MVRVAETKDAKDIAEIYNSAALGSNANYESNPKTIEDRAQWIQGLLDKGYPVLVAIREEKIAGFAALTPFHSLSGYRFTVSGSVYIREGFKRSGVGKELLTELRKKAKDAGIHCVIAGVNSQNVASISLLKSFGFEQVGYFKEIGFKNGVWLDDVCLQLVL